jgi:hypothetical protein
MGSQSSQDSLTSGEYGQGANSKDKFMGGLNVAYVAIIAFIVVVAVVVALLNSIWKQQK